MHVVDNLARISLGSSYISGKLSVLAMIHVHKFYENDWEALTVI